MPHNYPLLLDVSDRQIVIVGGGEVAVRKARGLLDAGAKKIRVVSPQVSEQMPPNVQRVIERYRREHLDDAELVFASTDDPQVNDAVARDAKAMNVLVCRADPDENNSGDFATPAVIRKGAVLVTVSTAGSPALAAKLRDRIEPALDARVVAMADLMQTLRPQIHSLASLSSSRRRDLFRTLASDEALDLLATKGRDELMRWIAQHFPEIKNDLT
jgi:siroheme synthase-like protein